MSKKLAYERYQWFHGRTMVDACPNAAHLAYDPSRRGYVYGDNGYDLLLSG